MIQALTIIIYLCRHDNAYTTQQSSNISALLNASKKRLRNVHKILFYIITMEHKNVCIHVCTFRESLFFQSSTVVMYSIDYKRNVFIKLNICYHLVKSPVSFFLSHFFSSLSRKACCVLISNINMSKRCMILTLYI